MSTDRELLELAAKAADYEIFRRFADGRLAVDTGSVITSDWNPLTDAGEALRLAVKLRLAIDHNHPADNSSWVVAERQGCEGCYAPVACTEDDFDEIQRAAVTCRAIVRAAAEIGKAMP